MTKSREEIIKEAADRAFLCHLKPTRQTFLTLMTEFATELDDLRFNQLTECAYEKFNEGKRAAGINIRNATKKVFER